MTPFRKKLLFTAILVFVPTVCVLLLTEVALRIAGFGYATTPMVQVKSGDQWMWTGNPDFTRLYFPQGLKRFPPPNFVAVDKPESTRRYMIVGGSAAAGDPDTDYSIARILEWLLSMAHPGLQWEVLNLAYTACNSHVAYEVVRQSTPYALDGIIVLVGNNEVIGPFGPGTDRTTALPSTLRRDLRIALRKTKLGQAGQRFAEAMARRAGTDDTWRGMEQYLDHRLEEDDPRLQGVYERFERNLAGMGRLARRRGIPALLSTVPVNLFDQPPFFDDSGDLSADVRKAVLHYMETGEAPERDAILRAATGTHPDSAYLRYAAGRLTFEAGENAAGEAHLRRALDLDQLRFRADSRINAVVREQWAQANNPWIPVDAEAALIADHPKQTLGFPHFYEHVHFSFRANFVIARKMARALLESEGLGTDFLDTVDWTEAASGLAYTAYDLWLILREMHRRFGEPPFTGIHGYGRLTAWMDELREALGAQVSRAETKEDIYGSYVAAIRARPGDDRLRLRLARFLSASGHAAEAHGIVSELFVRNPLDQEVARVFFGLSITLEDRASAEAALERITRIHPRHPALPRYREELDALGPPP